MPEWRMPDDLHAQLAEDEDGIWEDDRWSPVRLTVMTGTTNGDRDIPLAWQLEFEPDEDVFEAANRQITKLGIEPDGYGWANVLANVIAKYHPEVQEELHFGDTESATCVVWMEQEATCKTVLEVAWSMIHGSAA